MEIVFSGGTAEQWALWREALENLLNLPLGALPLTQHVAFVNPASVDPAETASTPFAATYWEPEALEGEVKVRNDAPGFGNDDAGLIAEAQSMGLTYDARRHFHETAAHETGHCVFAALPEEFRLRIAGLLGAKTIATKELFPASAEWKDRIGEAIAETFKEAFLPSRFRVFPARTSIRLTYARYPLFRLLVREGLAARGGEIIPPVEEGNSALSVPSGVAEAAGPRSGKVNAPRKIQGQNGGAIKGTPLSGWKPASGHPKAFCYEYYDFSIYPDLSGNDWPARHLGERDDEAFVLFPVPHNDSDSEFNDGTWGVDMSQFPESSHLAYSIEEEEIITT
jgi:hypothetical protein